MQVLLPPGWPRPRGYANGVTARGRMVFVAGMIGSRQKVSQPSLASVVYA